jgi:hypothetical protein
MWKRRDNSCYVEDTKFCQKHFKQESCCPSNHYCFAPKPHIRAICIPKTVRWDDLGPYEPIGDPRFFTSTRAKKWIQVQPFFDPYESTQMGEVYKWEPTKNSFENKKLFDQFEKLLDNWQRF